MNRTVPFVLFAAACAADRAAKGWALSALQQLPPDAPFLSLGLRFNRGIAFSLFEGSAALRWIAPLTGAAILAFLTFRRGRGRGARAAALLWAGVAGNALDRVLYGHVIDWFHIGLTVNLADVFLCLGALWLFAVVWSQKGEA